MNYEAKNFSITGLKEISDDQIAQHVDILYAGYVNKLNEISNKMRGVNLSAPNQIYSELRSLKSEESFALNGVILHELYFENLKGGSGTKSGGREAGLNGDLKKLIVHNFGSVETWELEFKACGMAARGWVILGFSTYDLKLHNYCLDSHNSLVPLSTIPILVMDVYEHAYAIDYGVKRPPLYRCLYEEH